MTRRGRLRALLVERLPGWTVGEWHRGKLGCSAGRALLVIDDVWCREYGRRWHGWAMGTDIPADEESGGDWCGRGEWPSWPEDLADAITAAVARIGTRKTCRACSGTGGGEQSCSVCGGAGRVRR